MVRKSSRALGVQKIAVWLFLGLATALAAQTAPSSFSPQRRLGYTVGDQWEPAITADGRGDIYILFPQYGPVDQCAACTTPTMVIVPSE